MVKWQKVRAGNYVTDDLVYETKRHEGLTWQDACYWLLSVNSVYVYWNAGQERPRRFRTLGEVKEFVGSLD